MYYNRGKLYAITMIVILCTQMVVTYAYGAKQTTYRCECGKIGKSEVELAPRIVGGVPSIPHNFPWVALILYYNVAMCGGSIINNYYILTAAHCVQPYKPSHTTVVLGVHDRILMNEGTEVLYKVVKSIVHPGHIDHDEYDENDIALLRMNTEIIFNDHIKPICLPNRGDEFTHKVATVAGWGKQHDEGYSSRFLHDITLEILSSQQCLMSKLGYLYSKLPDQIICAYQRNTDSCQGDSGGPLVTKATHDIMILIGLVSFGKICGMTGSPGAYTKVTHYLDWIDNNTKDAVYCRGFAHTAFRRRNDKKYIPRRKSSYKHKNKYNKKFKYWY